jgi:DNA invertase Pin-like site-specific DNA recombinase
MTESQDAKRTRGRPHGIGRKITIAQVIEIRELYSKRAQNGLTLRKIAKQFNIAYQTVHSIVQGKLWKVMNEPQPEFAVTAGFEDEAPGE